MKMGHRNVRRRGAVFVEAIVVLSFFTVCFLGAIYFRELYLGKMRVQRLARASAMAHAMGACKTDPKSGIEADLPKTPFDPPSPTPGHPLPLDAPPGKAAEAMAKVARAQGGTPLDTVTAITITTSAAATTRVGTSPRRQGFVSKEVASRSYVTCGDEVSDEQYGHIATEVSNLF